VKRTVEVIAPGIALPSVVRYADLVFCCDPSDKSLGYFQSSATRTVRSTVVVKP